MLAKLKQDHFITITCGRLHVKMVKFTTSHSKVYDSPGTGQISQLTLEEIPISANFEKLYHFSLCSSPKLGLLLQVMNLAFLNYFFKNFCWHNLVYSPIILGC